MREIGRAPKEKLDKLINLINSLDLEELETNQEIQELAKRYLQEGIIPKQYEDDALHIAIASVNNLDAVVSWNFTHIVRLKKKEKLLVSMLLWVIKR